MTSTLRATLSAIAVCLMFSSLGVSVQEGPEIDPLGDLMAWAGPEMDPLGAMETLGGSQFGPLGSTTSDEGPEMDPLGAPVAALGPGTKPRSRNLSPYVGTMFDPPSAVEMT